MATNEYRQYDHLEPILSSINGEYVRLNEEETRRNNMVLQEVLKEILLRMKKNPLFSGLFRREFYGGSYYDGLKVSKPNEYDLDLLLDLPACAYPIISDSEMPGYVKVQLENFENFISNKDEFVKYPNFAQKLLDEDYYLSTTKVLGWMESVLTKALNEFEILSEKYELIKQLQTSQGTYYFAVRKQGPAFTLKINGFFDGEVIKLDIDLVPCFAFKNQELPEYPYRQNKYYTLRDEFFVVPKKPKDAKKDEFRHWRLSFQQQEGILIKDKGKLKPTIRLLKRLRDSCSHTKWIASYYIKTIFLWEVSSADSNFWNKSLSYVFMTMLKKYRKYLEDCTIPYFWNKDNNLLCYLHRHTSMTILRTIILTIRDLETSRDPEAISYSFAKFIPEAMLPPDFWSGIEDLPAERRISEDL